MPAGKKKGKAGRPGDREKPGKPGKRASSARARSGKRERAKAARPLAPKAPRPDDRFREILDHSPFIHVEIDREGRILYANRTLTGDPVSAILGRSVHDLLPEGESARSREIIENVFLAGRPASFEIHDFPRGMNRYSIAIHVNPVMHRGRFRSASVIAEDISDRSRLRDDIAVRMEIEELLVSIAGEFIGVDPEHLERAIDGCLRRVGEAAGADTGGLFLFSQDRSRFFQRNAWAREGLDLGRLGPEGLETSSFPWSMRRFLANEPVLIESPESLPPEASGERRGLAAAGMRRFAGVPVASDGSVLGFVAFVYTELPRLSPADLLLVVRALGIILTGALGRREAALEARREEERFRDLVQQSLVGIGVFRGVPPRIMFANPAASEILGYPVEELIGERARGALDLIHPEDRPAVASRYARRLAGDTIPPHHEFRVLRKDGSVRWIEVFATAVSYLGEPAIQMMFVDRTQWKELAAALQRSEEKYRALAESAQDYIFLLDREMRVVYINPAGAAFFGVKPQALVGMEMNALMPPEIAEERRKNTLRVFETGEPAHLVNEVRFHAGTLVIDTTLAPVRDASGAVATVLGIARDITEQRRLEAERRRSEERYRLLAESANDFIMILGPDLRFRYANRALADFSGSTPEEMVGKRSGDFLPPEVAAVRDARIRLVLESGEPARFVAEFRTYGGTIFLDSSLIPLREEGREVSGVLIISRDVTEQNRTQEALKRSEERYRLLAESAQDAIFVVGEDMRFQYANKACADYLGLSPEELVGRTYREVLPEPAALARERGTRAVLEAGEPRRTTAEFPLERGRVVVDATLVPLPALPGEPRAVLGIAHDVTEQKRAEEIVRHHSEELEEEVRKRTEEVRDLERRQAEIDKLAAVGRMAGRIAHEVNNPLAGIRNALVLIQKKIPPEQEYAHYVPVMLREIERIATIISQMHKLHAPGTEAPTRFPLGVCVNEVTTLLGPISEKKDVRLDVSIPDGRVFVVLPEGLVKQILYNLILNAIEASPPKGRVSVRAEVARGSCLLEVSDQGPGIPPEQRARLFEPFFTTKKMQETGGLGLGLPIVRSILDALKGAIQFECPPGGGTTFRVRLPAGGEGSV